MVGDLLNVEIIEKQACSTNYQLTINGPERRGDVSE
jgi:hypothetical protein